MGCGLGEGGVWELVGYTPDVVWIDGACCCLFVRRVVVCYSFPLMFADRGR